MLQYLQILVRDVEVHTDHRRSALRLLRQVPILQKHHMHLAVQYQHRADCDLTIHRGAGSWRNLKR